MKSNKFLNIRKIQSVMPKLVRCMIAVLFCGTLSTVSFAQTQTESLQTSQLLTSGIQNTLVTGQPSSAFQELPQLAHRGGGDHGGGRWHGGGGGWHGGGPGWHGGNGWHGGAGWNGGRWNRNTNNWMFYSGIIPAAAIILSNTGGRRVYSCSANIDGVYYNGRFYDGSCHIFMNGNDYSTRRFIINTR